MSSKKEIGPKNKKKLIPYIIAPSISPQIVEKFIQFISKEETNDQSYLYNQNHEIQFFKYEGKYLPTIKFIRENPSIDLPIVKVDLGAVKHILNGADIFGQGITSINRNFEVNEIVLIANPQDAILCIGKSLTSSSETLNVKGKVIINLHYLGDLLWSGKI